MKLRPFAGLTVALLAVAAGCSKSEPAAPAHARPQPVSHEHKTPHGGTPVVLGHEAFHLEVVRDAAAGKLGVYVLDGEMENFVRIAAPTLEIVATVADAKQTLVLTAVADSATGEKVGDTALFEAQADWLKTTATFDAVLTPIEIRGTTFGAAFNFPKGNDKD